jgi:PhnB protein
MATKTARKTKVAKKPAKVKPIPDGYHSTTPYLIVDGASRAIDFYKRAFGARELMRMPAPGDRVGHAEIKIGDSVIMLADEHPEMNARGPAHYGGSPVSLLLYVTDVDRQFKQALAAGATEVRPVADQFYGDRAGTLKDPFGHSWHLHTHKENVSPAELKRRMAAQRS